MTLKRTLLVYIQWQNCHPRIYYLLQPNYVARLVKDCAPASCDTK